MTWNNRIFKHVGAGNITYALHETHYDKDGKVDGYTGEPMCGHFESVDELIASLKQMLSDAERSKDDVLDY
jgi:hypothetical protein